MWESKRDPTPDLIAAGNKRHVNLDSKSRTKTWTPIYIDIVPLTCTCLIQGCKFSGFSLVSYSLHQHLKMIVKISSLEYVIRESVMISILRNILCVIQTYSLEPYYLHAC